MCVREGTRWGVPEAVTLAFLESHLADKTVCPIGKYKPCALASALYASSLKVRYHQKLITSRGAVIFLTSFSEL